MAFEKIIPIAKAEEPDLMGSACEAKEPFVLMVLGDVMAPEFMEGEVIVIDPEGVARDGAFVLAYHNDEYTFRQLRIEGDQWFLAALNPAYPREPVSGPDAMRGVIVQKKTPGQRGPGKHY